MTTLLRLGGRIYESTLLATIVILISTFSITCTRQETSKARGLRLFSFESAEEEAAIKAAPVLPDRDEYGGWTGGPQEKATGFFRKLKRDGKWWLVTPSGHLYLSLGVDVLLVSDGFTIVENREDMFSWLPGKDDPLARHYGVTDHVLYGPTKKGRKFNSYSANLERKYSSDYVANWRKVSLDRLQAWGFTTAANWPEPAPVRPSCCCADEGALSTRASRSVHADFASPDA